MLFTISYELYHIICVILKLCCTLNIICYTLYVINYVSLYYILHHVVHCVFCLLHIFVPFIGIHKIQWQKRLFWLHKMKVSSTSQNIFPTLITFALSNPCCTHVQSDRNIIVSHRHCLCAVSAQWKGGWEILNSMLPKKSISQDCYLRLLHPSCRKQHHNEAQMYIRVTRKWIAGFKKNVFERSSFRKAPLKWHMRWQDIFKNTTNLWPAFTGCFFPPPRFFCS